MRIATYNFREGGEGNGKTPFEVLRDLQPDVLCAQELCETNFYTKNSRETWRELGYVDPHWHEVPTHTRRPWGSGIFLKNGPVKEVPITNPHINGWLVGVELRADHPRSIFDMPIHIFSIHTPTKLKPKINYYIWQLQEVLEYIFRYHGNDNIILAGDFNAEISVRGQNEHRTNDAREQEIRDYIRINLKLINGWQLLHPNESLPSTYVGQGKGTHIDGIFITPKIQHLLCSCDVIPKEKYQWKNADHCAIVADFSTKELQFRPRSTDLSE